MSTIELLRSLPSKLQTSGRLANIGKPGQKKDRLGPNSGWYQSLCGVGRLVA